MLPAPRNYAVWPSVMPADVSTEMVIAPTEKAFLFFEGETYTVTVISVNDDEPNYYNPLPRKTADVVAHDGVLRFNWTFSGEQEHLILLEYGEKKLQELSVYSLHEDLYRLLPLRGDLHAHSYRSDGRRDPAALAGHYREQGYDFLALTDHNRFFPGEEIDDTFRNVPMGLCRVRGEEVHAPGIVVHIVHVGGRSSVADLYVHNREQYEAEALEYEARVPDSVPEKYRSRYARVMWVTDHIHQAGGLAIFPHPYWRPGGSRMFNVCEEFSRILLSSGMFDAYELVGGMQQPDVNLSVALWNELRAEGLRIPVVGSSDVHALEASITFPYHFTVCFAERNDNDAIMAAVKSGSCVAVEGNGTEYDRQFRCYGQLRLVQYAQFLLRHYFPQLQRICQGEGVAMRAYAMDDADAALIRLQAEQAEAYRDRFFGRRSPALPSANVRDFEEKWRQVQLNGPLTKGGIVDPPVTRNI